MADIVYSMLFDSIDEYRVAAGNYDLETRRAFVEQFMDSHYDGVYEMFEFKHRWGTLVRDWAESLYQQAVDCRSVLGRRVIANLLGGITANVLLHLGEAIQAVAEEVTQEVAAEAAEEAVEALDYEG